MIFLIKLEVFDNLYIVPFGEWAHRKEVLGFFVFGNFDMGLPSIYEHLIPYFRAHFRQSLGSQRVVDKYFSPPSGAMATITPLSISAAFSKA